MSALALLAFSGLAASYKFVGQEGLVFHQYIGQFLIVILAVRIAVGIFRRPQGLELTHATRDRRLVNLVHVGLYVCMIAYVELPLIRSLLEEIRLIPIADGPMEIELIGELAGLLILGVSQNEQSRPAAACSSVMVAGA